MIELRLVRLAEVADIESGAGFPLHHQGKNREQYPFLKVSDMNLVGNDRCIYRWNHSVSEETRVQLRARAFPPGTVIFPKIGAAIATNKKRIITKPSCVDNNVMGATPKPDSLVSEYLYHLFRATDISQFASASNPPSIRKSEVENWMVRIPPLGEQRRIVGLLDRAAEIRRRADAARAKARAIIPALFLNTFGDPATNPKGWPMVTVGDLLESAAYGTSLKANDRNEGIPMIRMGNVTTGGQLDTSDLKHIHIVGPEREKAELLPGDLLFNRTNSKELVGKTGLWDGRFGAVAASYFIRLRAKRDRCDPTYLWAFFNAAFMKRMLFDTARGAIGQANINAKELRAFRVAAPPVPLQTAFAEQVHRLESLARHLDAAAAKAAAMAASLSAEVFG